MNTGEGLNILDYLATGFNKNDPVLQALFSDFTGIGAVGNEADELVRFIDYYTRTDDVKNHAGYTLEMITKLFAKMPRQLMETDSRLLRRMRALTERKGDTVWGTGLDLEHVFETYFAGIRAYVCENTGKDTLLRDGDFEEDGGWQLAGAARYEYEARFSEKRGLYFDGTGEASCEQTLENLEAGIYTLHFFLRGACGVVIRNGAGKYWDATVNANEYILAWSDTVTVNRFENAGWRDAFCFVVLSEAEPRLTIRFVNTDDRTASIDYARFFVKPPNPSYSIVVRYEGYVVTGKTMRLGIGNDDPYPEISDYKKESYFDHSYIIGRVGAYRSEVYKSILDIVRPRGIQPFFEFVEKIIKD
jgi:hypothetical protein